VKEAGSNYLGNIKKSDKNIEPQNNPRVSEIDPKSEKKRKSIISSKIDQYLQKGPPLPKESL